MTVITRFAPSPTGYLHIGNARMALVNYLFTKKQNGKFILRIDDTDLERSNPMYTEAIREDLTWLGIEWDSSFSQSDKLDIYQKYMTELVEKGRLYPCYETKEELEYKKKLRLAKGEPPIYDRAMLNLTAKQKFEYEQQGRTPHYRFKMEHTSIEWNDLVKGDIKFQGENISDPVLVKDNGVFLYSLCSVIDDIESNITDIIRGEDHLTNTAMHVQLFEALGGTPPNFGHMSLISMLHGEEISKRTGSMSLRSLRDQGIYKDAILNYLYLLGQTEDSKLDFSLTEMSEKFNLNNYGKALVKFDLAKLDQINSINLQKLAFTEVEPELKRLNLAKVDQNLWNLYKNNITHLTELENGYNIIYGDITIDNSSINKNLITAALNHLPNNFSTNKDVEGWLQDITASSNIKGKDLFMGLRLALTGEHGGIPFKDLIMAIGISKIKQRLEKLI
ncbi:glutamate--tRNA ligase [Rickettsiales bacterium LUAb2]